MNYFETVLLLDPELSDSNAEGHIKAAKDIITQKGGEIVNELSWGKKKLAYLINNYSVANFHIIRHKGSEDVNSELATKVRITDGMLRQMTVVIKENELERNFDF
ncbi:MAG: 30S ribosomal protein S6 [Nitrospinae bacterium]|nr:30S ribosomal protein S6 [Nitrospinota bacterium]